MRRLENPFILLAVAMLLLLSAAAASAATDVGTFCWTDNFGALWKLSFESFAGTNNLAVTGVRVPPAVICNGVREQPLSGTLRVLGSSAVLGVASNSNEPGVCISLTWHGTMPLSTAVVTGGFRNQLGIEGTFTLFPVLCSLPLSPGRGSSDSSADPSSAK